MWKKAGNRARWGIKRRESAAAARAEDIACYMEIGDSGFTISNRRRVAQAALKTKPFVLFLSVRGARTLHAGLF